MNTTSLRTLCIILLATAWTGLHAQPSGSAPGTAATAGTPRQAPDKSGLTLGEIRKIDLEAGKLTLRHEAIVPLDMPAMTMSFQLKDPRLVDGLKVGDTVRFAARKEGGSYLLTHVEKAQ